jgi:hypothetical protein
MAAASLILEEAGGRVLDPTGKHSCGTLRLLEQGICGGWAQLLRPGWECRQGVCWLGAVLALPREEGEASMGGLGVFQWHGSFWISMKARSYIVPPSNLHDLQAL